MSKKANEEIGLVEIAALGGVHRQTAYWAVRAGEIAGGHKILGQIWVAPRREVMKWVRKREREAKLRREEAEHNPGFAVQEAVRNGMAVLSDAIRAVKPIVE